GRLEAEVLLGREVALQRPQQADEEEDRADDDVRTVEAGGHEERRAVDVPGVVERRVAILVGLQQREHEAKANRQRQAPDETLAVVLEQRVMGPRYRRAGQQ